jgi:hypothetical protein
MGQVLRTTYEDDIPLKPGHLVSIVSSILC